MQKIKMSITLNETLSKEIKIVARKHGISASCLIENVMNHWKKEVKKQQLMEGYQAMVQENFDIAQDFQTDSWQVWPDA